MSSKPAIILIPGGFCSPEAYAKLASTLEEYGYETIVIRLRTCTDSPGGDPSTSEWKTLAQLTPFDDAKLVHEALSGLAEQGKEALLVGHSYGSLPMLASCQGWTTRERSAKGLQGGIKGVVYLAGFTHAQRGKGIMGNTEYLPVLPYHKLEVIANSNLGKHGEERLTHRQEGILLLQPDAIPLFFSDMPEEDRQAAADKYTLKYMTRSAFAFYPEYIDADIPVVKSWILPEQDAVVDPQYQEMFIQSGGVQHVARVSGGHLGFVEKPAETAVAIKEAAER